MKTTYDIYMSLREEIIQGKLNPGERLVEKDISSRLETTRGYVRDALKLLNADGFVLLSPGKGATVAKISYQETKDLYELLALLESKSVELAAPLLKKPDLEKLGAANCIMKKCIATEDRSEARTIWQESNFQFHKLFAEKSGNRELKEMVENIRWRTFDFRYVYLFEPHFVFFVDQHTALIEAVKIRKFAQAKKIMEDHVHKASLVVLKSMEKLAVF
jgi:DNA-binding GntR family transcriptional regulator